MEGRELLTLGANVITLDSDIESVHPRSTKSSSNLRVFFGLNSLPDFIKLRNKTVQCQLLSKVAIVRDGNLISS